MDRQGCGDPGTECLPGLSQRFFLQWEIFLWVKAGFVEQNCSWAANSVLGLPPSPAVQTPPTWTPLPKANPSFHDMCCPTNLLASPKVSRKLTSPALLGFGPPTHLRLAAGRPPPPT